MRFEVKRTNGTEEYDVPTSEGTTVLDALGWVREHEDPSLAVRFSCRSANACRECIAVVDGRRAYLCTVRLTEGMVVEPLGNQPLVHDLVVDH